MFLGINRSLGQGKRMLGVLLIVIVPECITYLSQLDGNSDPFRPNMMKKYAWFSEFLTVKQHQWSALRERMVWSISPYQT